MSINPIFENRRREKALEEGWRKITTEDPQEYKDYLKKKEEMLKYVKPGEYPLLDEFLRYSDIYNGVLLPIVKALEFIQKQTLAIGDNDILDQQLSSDYRYDSGQIFHTLIRQDKDYARQLLEKIECNPTTLSRIREAFESGNIDRFKQAMDSPEVDVNLISKICYNLEAKEAMDNEFSKKGHDPEIASYFADEFVKSSGENDRDKDFQDIMQERAKSMREIIESFESDPENENYDEWEKVVSQFKEYTELMYVKIFGMIKSVEMYVGDEKNPMMEYLVERLKDPMAAELYEKAEKLYNETANPMKEEEEEKPKDIESSFTLKRYENTIEITIIISKTPYRGKPLAIKDENFKAQRRQWDDSMAKSSIFQRYEDEGHSPAEVIDVLFEIFNALKDEGKLEGGFKSFCQFVYVFNGRNLDVYAEDHFMDKTMVDWLGKPAELACMVKSFKIPGEYRVDDVLRFFTINGKKPDANTLLPQNAKKFRDRVLEPAVRKFGIKLTPTNYERKKSE